jgi:hypothetical protein
VVVVIIDELLKKAKRGSLPPLAVGMGIYLPMSLTLLIPVGALLGRLYDNWAKRTANPEFAERMGVLLATGLIVGESIAGVVFAMIVGATRLDTPLALVAENPWAVPLSIVIFTVAIPRPLCLDQTRGRFGAAGRGGRAGTTACGGAAIGLAAAPGTAHTLVGQPEPGRGLARLPEDVDRHAAARVPIAADAQPLRLHLFDQPLADADRHVLVEAAMVAERAQEELEALGFDDGRGGRIVDDEMAQNRAGP